MEAPDRLPLPTDQLPEKLRRFADANAPAAAKMMAAKGLVPVSGNDMVTLLVQLTADPERSVADAARTSLIALPDQVLLPAAESPLHPAILGGLAQHVQRELVRQRLALNAQLSDHAMERIARNCSEAVGEIIATNQQRILGAPPIVEALYKNRNVRMSTADRLIELCARHHIDLPGIPAYKAHVQAIQGQLIPEPTDEPLPMDTMFQEAIEEDDDDDAVDVDKVSGEEALKEKFKPLSFRIRAMSNAEKLRLAVVGGAAARSILIRDPNRAVAQAAITSPAMSDAEAASIAHSKEVSVDILRYIGGKPQWIRSYEVKRALIFNPKTPVGTGLRFLSHMRMHDLKALSRSRGVPNPVKAAARNRLAKKEKGN